MEDAILGPYHMTVIFRNDGPMDYAGDCPSYRSVRIDLTREQQKQLRRYFTHSSGSSRYYEEVSRVIPHLKPENDVTDCTTSNAQKGGE